MKKYLSAFLSIALTLLTASCLVEPNPMPRPEEDKPNKAIYTVEVSQDYLEIVDIYVVYIASDGSSKTAQMTGTTFTYEYSKKDGNFVGFAVHAKEKSGELSQDSYSLKYKYNLNVVPGSGMVLDETHQFSIVVEKDSVSDYLATDVFPFYFSAAITAKGAEESSFDAPTDGSLDLIE